MIKSITIKNFKAIREGTVNLTPLHLLIGPNDSGKTSILEAIAAICRSVDHDATNSFLGRWRGRELVNSNADSSEVKLLARVQDSGREIEFRVDASFASVSERKVAWTKGVAIVSTEEKELCLNGQWMAMAYARIDHSFAASRDSRFAWEESDTLCDELSSCWYLRWNARNLALPVALNANRRFRIEGNGFGLATLIDDLLNYDREKFAELEREFVQIFPNVKSIALVQQPGFDSPVDQADETLELRPSPGKQIVFRLKNSNHDLPASQAAEGMLYILGYLAIMYLPDPPRVLLIEEPENGIHPLRVADIVRILRKLVEKHPEVQIVMSTHSPYLVDAFEPQEVTWCHRDRDTGDVVLTRLDTLPEVQRSLKMFSLGEIWTGELESQPEPLEVD